MKPKIKKSSEEMVQKLKDKIDGYMNEIQKDNDIIAAILITPVHHSVFVRHHYGKMMLEDISEVVMRQRNARLDVSAKTTDVKEMMANFGKDEMKNLFEYAKRLKKEQCGDSESKQLGNAEDYDSNVEEDSSEEGEYFG